MGSSPGFGPNPSDFPDESGVALFGLAFAAAPQVSLLNQPLRFTRRLILQ